MTPQWSCCLKTALHVSAGLSGVTIQHGANTTADVLRGALALLTRQYVEPDRGSKLEVERMDSCIPPNDWL